MTEHIENPVDVTKVDNSTAAKAGVADTAEQKRIDHIAGEAAKKAGRTEQKYDKGHSIFTK